MNSRLSDRDILLGSKVLDLLFASKLILKLVLIEYTRNSAKGQVKIGENVFFLERLMYFQHCFISPPRLCSLEILRDQSFRLRI